MGRRVNAAEARAKFAEALALARADAELPKGWIERTERIGKARSKTFTPGLGTVLLAKATDGWIDAFSLREGESHKS